MGRSGIRARGLAALATAVVAVTVTVSACAVPTGRYVDEVFTEVESTLDVVYRSTTTAAGDPIDLRLDIFEPAGDTATERPVIMWMFGGGFVGGNKEQVWPLAEDSARRGYVGVSVQYRVNPRAANLDELRDAGDLAYDDAVAAAEWLKDNAATYGMDPDAIIAAGVSAGAFNALNLLYYPGTRGPATSPVAGAVSLIGSSFATPPPGRPPAILFHARDDDTVPYVSAEDRCTHAREVGNVCLLITYKTGGHEELVRARAPEMLDRSAVFLMNQVLRPLGYAPGD